MLHLHVRPLHGPAFCPNSMLVSLSGAAVLLGSGRALLLQAAEVAVEAQPLPFRIHGAFMWISGSTKNKPHGGG